MLPDWTSSNGKQGIVCLYKEDATESPCLAIPSCFCHVTLVYNMYIHLYILFGYCLVPFSCMCFHFSVATISPFNTAFPDSFEKTRSALKTTPVTDERPWAGEIGSVQVVKSEHLVFAEWCSNLILQNLHVIPVGLRQGWQNVGQYFHVFLQMQLKCQAIQVYRDMT